MSEKDRTSVTVVEKHDLPELVHPLAAQILAQNPDTQTLRELMALQKDWEENEARKAYSRALVDLKRDLPTVIGKDQTVDFKNKAGVRTCYTHASLAVVMEAVTETLTQYGFSLAWIPSNDKQTVSVTCRLTHTEGHFGESTISAPVDTSGNKGPAQGVASTITLLQRYSALSLLGIATKDMEEPKGEAPSKSEAPTDYVNMTLNMKAVRAVKGVGHTKEDAEKRVGKPVKEWTATEIDNLRAWVDEIKKELAKSMGKPEEKPGERLAEVMRGIDMAQSETELDTVKVWIAKAKLSPEDADKAEAARKTKLETLTAGREPGEEG